jgi:mannose-1-phosphate guanylyltransferase
MKSHCYCVIIAGGKGTRFWPLSRAQRPKQLLKIMSRKSLIRESTDRVLSLAGRNQTLVVTVAEQLGALRKELSFLPRNNFLGEPQGKNTAPCIGLAALELIKRDPEAVMIILPADHWVSDSAGFRRTLRSGIELASHHDHLITIGIRPSYPETGYGYILKGKSLRGSPGAGAYRVQRFKEKPSLALAWQLIRRGSLWNSGIFIWKASTILGLLRRYQPEIHRRLEEIKNGANEKSLALPNPRLRNIMSREYQRMPNLSIDHAVLEKAGSDGKVLTLEANFGWSDIGSWAAVHRMMRQDQNGNAGNGQWFSLDSRNCLIHAPNRLVALLGIENLVVVDTPDALLVGDLNRSQEVRELVEKLNLAGYGAYTVN